MAVKTVSLEDLIRAKIPLGKLSATGFHSVRCQCCNDYKSRGGWKITPTEIFYNCFNCGIGVGYDPIQGYVSKKFNKVLKDFGFTQQEIDSTKSHIFFLNKSIKETISLASLKTVNLFTPEVELPIDSRRLQDTSGDVLEQAIGYIKKRNLDPYSHPYFISTATRFKDRIIIPFYRQGKLIYWQARSLIEKESRYLNCEASKEAVLFNHDELFGSYELPLFITEGIFDALHLKGVALVGSKLNEAKLQLLKQSRRKLIFVIDQDENGKKLGLKILDKKLGNITFCPGGYDVDSSIKTYGRLWTIFQLMQNQLESSFEAQVNLELKCKKRK